MSDKENYTPEESLVDCVVRTLGKKVFLKAVEKVCGSQRKPRTKRDVPADLQCCARTRGEKTGIKVGKYSLYYVGRCDRRIISDSLCAIHTNERKKGALKLGLYDAPLTEDQKKVFGDV